MPRLPDLFSPVSDKALPHLMLHKRRGTITLAAVNLFGSVGGVGLDMARGVSSPLRGAAILLPTVVASVGTAVVLVRRPRANADWALAAIAISLFIVYAGDPWVRYDGATLLLPYLQFLPIVFAAVAAWRPALTLGLGAATTAVFAGAHALGAFRVEDLGVVYEMNIIITVGAAVWAQSQRRLWLKFEEARAQLAASERMGSLGRMTAGVAHELKTPLAAAMNATESLTALTGELEESIGHPDVTNDDLHEVVKEMRDAQELVRASVARSAQFIHALRAHTLQLDERDVKDFAVAPAIEQVLTLLGHDLRRNGIVVDRSAVDPALRCAGDPGKLGQIVTNLLSNAVDASERAGGKRIVIVARSEGDEVVLRVEDEGDGVPPDVRSRIFDLLFTTKGTRGGTGLGLAISRDLAEGAFGGRLDLVPSERGAHFELRIPHQAKASGQRGAWTPAVSMPAAGTDRAA